MKPLVEVRGLTIEFPMRAGLLRAVNEADFVIPEGQITALVGESGSGKSTMASAIMRAIAVPGRVAEGSIHFDGHDVMSLSKKQLQSYKWEQAAMVFQAAQNALNPVMRIKDQMVETFRAHSKTLTEKQMLDKARSLLDYVRLEPDRVLNAFPHELSGGMKQRVMIAFSLLLDPQLVILDEPTTALDVITQAYIFDILTKIHKDMNITMLLLTHDIGVVAKVADRVGVMYAGNVVEAGGVYDMFKRPKHPYTAKLMKAVPSLYHDLAEREGIPGSPPDLLNMPPGCPFAPRCELAHDKCRASSPAKVYSSAGHEVACHLYPNASSISEVRTS
ncbi:peptide/nickel transport system ATP-binding protein [Paenibacillus sp. UNC496MF]|uniref:ABC transporter ATP-binding protein n=1 Tax=Paenibacillus sp. UNC496MF TaxID=1502753 RepID=UPI0008F39A54|nr:ABC transporter ATP-binding protein [Paenibacillus sp. UNC496MF]SFJ17298.1 peptide/nickel transport system ATP-binding protein [Paenibacillus sp. UNC496MF]